MSLFYDIGKIIIEVKGGLIHRVSFDGTPDDCPPVEVRDYDIDGAGEADLSKDESGNEYVESLWEPPSSDIEEDEKDEPKPLIGE